MAGRADRRARLVRAAGFARLAVAVALVVSAAALVTSSLAARRAARVEPVELLRSE
jgi:ABC-type lipoprotein release transport system permease subunit